MEKSNEKLHPSLRIAGVAWLLSRIALYAALLIRFGSFNAILLQLSGEISKQTPTTPLFAWLRSFFYFMNETYANSGTYAYLLIGECLMLAGTIGVYTYARKHVLPQVAERATWLWAFSPAMLATVLGGPWELSIGLTTAAFGLSVRRHPYLATILAAMAIGISPEVILIAPALIAETWCSREKMDEAGPMTMTAALPTTFVATIFTTILWGDGVKAFQGPADWRHDWSLHALLDFLTTPSFDWFIMGFAAGVFLLHTLWANRLPKRTMLALPALLYPLLFVPSVSAIGIIVCTLPAFIICAFVTEDPERERPLILGSMLLMMLMFLTKASL